MEPTKEWKDLQKKTFGDVYRVSIGGEVYVYRKLRRSEYKDLQKSMTPEMGPNGPVVSAEQSQALEERIAEVCTIWPENYKELDSPAGVPTVLAGYISNSSGFDVDAPPELL